MLGPGFSSISACNSAISAISDDRASSLLRFLIAILVFCDSILQYWYSWPIAFKILLLFSYSRLVGVEIEALVDEREKQGYLAHGDFGNFLLIKRETAQDHV